MRKGPLGKTSLKIVMGYILLIIFIFIIGLFFLESTRFYMYAKKTSEPP